MKAIKVRRIDDQGQEPKEEKAILGLEKLYKAVKASEGKQGAINSLARIVESVLGGDDLSINMLIQALKNSK